MVIPRMKTNLSVFTESWPCENHLKYLNARKMKTFSNTQFRFSVIRVYVNIQDVGWLVGPIKLSFRLRNFFKLILGLGAASHNLCVCVEVLSLLSTLHDYQQGHINVWAIFLLGSFCCCLSPHSCICVFMLA